MAKPTREFFGKLASPLKRVVSGIDALAEIYLMLVSLDPSFFDRIRRVRRTYRSALRLVQNLDQWTRDWLDAFDRADMHERMMEEDTADLSKQWEENIGPDPESSDTMNPKTGPSAP